MKPASRSLRTSYRMKSCRSTDCFRGFCRTGLASGWIFRWCSITFLGIPGICDGSQANTSTFARRKATSASSYFSPRFPATRVVWERSDPIWTVFTGTSSESDGRTLGTFGAFSDTLVPEAEGPDPSGWAASVVKA